MNKTLTVSETVTRMVEAWDVSSRLSFQCALAGSRMVAASRCCMIGSRDVHVDKRKAKMSAQSRFGNTRILH